MPIFPRSTKKALGIYVHVPFCRSKCIYCAFYSEANCAERLMDDYLQAICDHIKEYAPLVTDYLVDTVYIGGGTPSYIGADRLAAILTTIRQNFDVSPQAEITFEANPDSVSIKALRRLKSEGFNRVSLGIQSDNDDLLHTIGRPHTYEQAVEAVRLIRKAGFHNLSVDLIFGLPGQTLSAWQDTLANVLRLNPDHISCYALECIPGTPLYEHQAMYDLANDDTQADMYLAAVEMLKVKHFRHYEISNFAKKGMESKHNSKYWFGDEYLGFGPEASSYFAGKRFHAVSDIHKYIDGIRNHGEVLDEVQEIPPHERAGEYVMLQTRTAAGLSREEYARKFLLPFDKLEEVFLTYQQTGHALFYKGRWILTPAGMFISDKIITELLEAQDRSIAAARKN